MIRPLTIGDLPRLFLQSGTLTGNQVAPREALLSSRASGLRFRRLVKQWFSPGDSFHGWICLEDGRLCGLVSVRERSSRRTWEIDRLLCAGLDPSSGQALVEAMGNAATEKEVLKVFLRLPQDSPMLDIAKQAGFCSYLEEKLFRARNISLKPNAVESAYSFQPHSEAEEQGLFQLYCQAVPAAVRSAEGMTLKEWQASREPTSGHNRQFTCCKSGELVGWLRTTTSVRSGLIDLMTRPNHTEAVLTYSLYCLRHKSSISCLVPAFQSDLASLLAEREFEIIGNYISLFMETASRVRQPQLAPVQA